MNTQLKIEGMTCGHCVAGVKKALESVPGVEAAEVYLSEGRATVKGKAELNALLSAVEEEGYSASSFGQESPATVSDPGSSGHPEGA